MKRPAVLYVSKPVVPPFHDGTKCLVRDVATHLSRHRAQVMVAPGAPPLGERSSADVELVRVYGASGSYTPALSENARAAAFLFLRSQARLWHFVFAPNPRTSAFGSFARAVRRVPVVQTVASPPRQFSPGLFFGDRIVAQSTWTKQRIEEAFSDGRRAPPEIRVVPPPVPDVVAPSPDAVARAVAPLRLPDSAPVFVYPGDIESATARETVARAVAPIARALPGAIVVFACRPKTAEAPRIERELMSRLGEESTRFVREIDLLALYGRATAVLFPVEDLTGKVDLPIALLEAMRLGVPVVASDRGPLTDLEGVARVPPADAEALARRAVDLAATGSAERERLIEAAKTYVNRRHGAQRIAEAYESLYDELLRAPPAP